MRKVFISYSIEDRNLHLITLLLEHLRKNNYDVIVSDYGLDYPMRILNASLFIGIITNKSNSIDFDSDGFRRSAFCTGNAGRAETDLREPHEQFPEPDEDQFLRPDHFIKGPLPVKRRGDNLPRHGYPGKALPVREQQLPLRHRLRCRLRGNGQRAVRGPGRQVHLLRQGRGVP